MSNGWQKRKAFGVSLRGVVLRVQLAMHSAWNWLEAATGVAWGWDVQVAVDMRLEGAALCESCFACQKDGCWLWCVRSSRGGSTRLVELRVKAEETATVCAV